MTILEYIQTYTNEPGVKSNNSIWFNSPFRSESKPSFQFTPTIGEYGKFHDWGSGSHGSGIDFIRMCENCDFNTAINILNSRVVTRKVEPIKKENIVRSSNIVVGSFTKNKLIEYAKRRCVAKDVLYKYCMQVEEGLYFYIGLKNVSGGYAVRNEGFKGFKGSGSFSFFKENPSSVLVFEGMFDMMSFMSITSTDKSIIVLNSTSFVENILPILKSFPDIHLYLDNDRAGDKATEQIKLCYGHAIDHRFAYEKHNDVNDFITIEKQDVFLSYKNSFANL